MSADSAADSTTISASSATVSSFTAVFSLLKASMPLDLAAE